MKRKLFYLILIVLLLSGTQLFAQGTNPPVFSIAAEYTKLIPNSPEAEAMAKYGIIPVTLYTGMPNVAVPIYDIRWGSLSLPISLTYNNNGLKPAEEASRVGLGWCLNAGGVITRVVNGMVDESTSSRRFDSYPNLYDFNFEQAILDSIANGKTDGEPDVYIFNFNGITGKFICLNGMAYFSCQQDLKIEVIGDDDFRIITEDGTKYDFREKETTSSHQLQGGFIPSYTSAWFLSSITSKDGKDIITFSYTSKPYQSNSVFSDSYKEEHKYMGDITKTFSSNLISTSITTNKELVSVDFGNNNVQFIQDITRRLDIQNNEDKDKRALKSILVHDNNSTLIKKFDLITGYFGSDSRLKLNGIKQMDNNDKLLSQYVFDYFDSGSLPEKNTRSIDYWGFYNGKYNTSLISKTECNSDLGGDRSPDFVSAQIGLLHSITYPTGGITTFEYESNYYSNGTVQNVFAPHSTSTTTVFNNSNNGGPVTTSLDFNINVGQFIHFTYSRNISNFPSYGVKSYYPMVKIMNGNIQLYSRIINYMNLQESDSLYLPLGSYTMILSCESTANSTYATLGYKEQTQQVSPGTIGPGLRVKNITSDDKISGKTIVKNYMYTNVNGTSSGHLNSYVGDGVITTNWQTSTMQGYNLTYTAGMHSGIGGMLENEFYYNRVTETTSDGTVTGKTTTDFNALYSSISSVAPTKETVWKSVSPIILKKVKETKYNYELFSTKDVIGIKSRLSGYLNGLDGFSESTNPLDTVSHAQIYISNGLPMSFVYYRLRSEMNITYSDNLVDSTINTKNYYYNSKYSSPDKVFDKNSKRERILTRSVFPNNYPVLSSSVLTPEQIEDNYNNAMAIATSNYLNGRSNAMDNCLPYYGQYWTDATFKHNVKINSGYIPSYFTAYRQATIDRINSLSTYYTSINNAITQSSDQNTKALLIMQRDHIVSSPVEQMTYKRVNNSTLLTASIKSSFSVMPDNVPVTESIWATELTAPIDSTNFTTSDYKKKIEFTYDNDFKLVQQKKVNDVPRSYLWDYSKQYPVAEVINASHGDIAYTSFEANETGGWNVGSSGRNTSYALTGKCSYDVGNGLSTTVSSETQYILSYWSRNGNYSISGGSIVNTTTGKTVNGWTLYEHELSSNPGTLTITGSGLIDEVRLYPKGAQMTSYTYAPLVGMTSQNDAKNSILYYNYDTFDRLANITDGDQNILKEYTYNYGTNPSNNLFYNAQRTQSFPKSGCAEGYHGSLVPYTVPLGRYSSSLSQAAADQLAQDEIDANGQNNANALGSCISNATHAVSIGLDPLITLGDIGLCTITIRDAGNNTILLNRTNTGGFMFLKPTSIPASSNGYYTVTIVPDASIPITVNVNAVYKDLFSSQTWTQVSGDISIIISPYIDFI